MTYLLESIKPTRIYTKQCSHCGKNYMGKHTGVDIEKYPGSGLVWARHLKKHNAKSIHIWNSDWFYDTSIVEYALNLSKKNNIVESKDWFNLEMENGLDGGWGGVHDRPDVLKLVLLKRKETRKVRNTLYWTPEAHSKSVFTRKSNGSYVITPESIVKMKDTRKAKGCDDEAATRIRKRTERPIVIELKDTVKEFKKSLMRINPRNIHCMNQIKQQFIIAKLEDYLFDIFQIKNTTGNLPDYKRMLNSICKLPKNWHTMTNNEDTLIEMNRKLRDYIPKLEQVRLSIQLV